MDELEIRVAERDDVGAICQFGASYVGVHYAPLIGAEAADEQVRRWWAAAYVDEAATAGQIVVAVVGEEIVGVAQRGRAGLDHVLYKLYVHPDRRGLGIGPRLLDAIVAELPNDADRLYVEHFVANGRAGEFYEREGFAVERIEPNPADHRLDVAWRSRRVPFRRP